MPHVQQCGFPVSGQPLEHSAVPILSDVDSILRLPASPALVYRLQRSQYAGRQACLLVSRVLAAPRVSGDNEFDSLETLLLLRISTDNAHRQDGRRTVRGAALYLSGPVCSTQKNAHTYLINPSATAQGPMCAEQNSPGWPARAAIPLRVRPPYTPSHA